MSEWKATITERNGWSYVVHLDGTMPEHWGPWRYRWEAQEYADELNASRKPTGRNTG